MWTVTLLLKPVIVTLHLLGGMATFALLAWLALRQHALSDGGDASSVAARRLQPWALGGLAILVLQIALGGWVSSNYAALACIDFPTCHGVWRPDMDFRHGFQLVRELGRTAAGEHLAYEALTAIHWTHRVGALVTFLYLGALALALAQTRSLGGYAAALAVALTVQVGLGIANVLGGVPLATAVTHNAVAAILLALLVMINFALSRAFLHSTLMVPTVAGQHAGSRLRQFYALTKPRVVSLIVFTAVIGMFLAVPGAVPLRVLAAATLGIALVAGAAAAVNCLVEQKIDALMARTRWRPLPRGRDHVARDTALRRRDRRHRAGAAVSLGERAHDVAHARHVRRLRGRSTR